MTLTDIKYNDVQESFGMGGPYIGKLEFQGKLLDGEFLADNEKLSRDKSRFVFSKYIGTKKNGFFWTKAIREFKILIYDEPTNSFYQSKNSFDALAIENMTDNDITYHIAFHTEIEKFKRHIEFNEQNFIKVSFEKKSEKSFDNNFTQKIVEELKKRLNRELTTTELKAFTIKRSGLAYEMILDYIMDDSLTREDIENYVDGVVNELKT